MSSGRFARGLGSGPFPLAARRPPSKFGLSLSSSPSTTTRMSAASRRPAGRSGPLCRSGTGSRRTACRAHARITVVGVLPCGRAAVHTAESPAILRRWSAALNLAIAEPVTLLHLRPHLARRRSRHVLPYVPLILRPQGLVGIRHPRAVRSVVRPHRGSAHVGYIPAVEVVPVDERIIHHDGRSEERRV